MALYVSPIVSGKVIRSRGGSTSEFTPGYVKPKHEVNPLMTLRRLPDEDPQNLADPVYRRRRIILQNMKDEELAIAQVEEKQAVSAVLSGKYTMTGEAFEPVEVDMGRSAGNNIVRPVRLHGQPATKKRMTRPMTLKPTRSTPAVWSTSLCSIRKAGRCSVPSRLLRRSWIRVVVLTLSWKLP